MPVDRPALDRPALDRPAPQQAAHEAAAHAHLPDLSSAADDNGNAELRHKRSRDRPPSPNTGLFHTTGSRQTLLDVAGEYGFDAGKLLALNNDHHPDLELDSIIPAQTKIILPPLGDDDENEDGCSVLRPPRKKPMLAPVVSRHVHLNEWRTTKNKHGYVGVRETKGGRWHVRDR